MLAGCRLVTAPFFLIAPKLTDDFVAGFERKADAETFWAELKDRFRKFGLELHEDKTR